MLSSGVTALTLWWQMVESVKNINRLHAGSEKKRHFCSIVFCCSACAGICRQTSVVRLRWIKSYKLLTKFQCSNISRCGNFWCQMYMCDTTDGAVVSILNTCSLVFVLQLPTAIYYLQTRRPLYVNKWKASILKPTVGAHVKISSCHATEGSHFPYHLYWQSNSASCKCCI